MPKLPVPLYCVSYHDPSALHRNAVTLHQASDGKGAVYLVMCEMMNKASGNFGGRGQWGKSFITLLGYHRPQKSRGLAHPSNNKHQMGGKKKVQCWFKFLHIWKCIFISIKSWPIFNQKSPLYLATSEDWHCQQDAEISGPGSLGSDAGFPRGSTQAGLPPRGPWTASHVRPSASPHCHHCRGGLEQTQGIKRLMWCCTAGPRCTSNWNHKNESGPRAPSPCRAQALPWSPPWGHKKGPELSLKGTRWRERSVIFLD